MNAPGTAATLDPAVTSTAELIRLIRATYNLNQREIARILGTSLVSIARLEGENVDTTAEITHKINELYARLCSGQMQAQQETGSLNVFASHGARRNTQLPLFDQDFYKIELTENTQAPIARRLNSQSFWGRGKTVLAEVLSDYVRPSPTITKPAAGTISAGKNTYTYDAHTYHTKVPPQGIAQIVKQYLPNGGLVLDPFSGSGMTGVATRTLGYDVVLNEISPAASFISDRFTQQIDPAAFSAGVRIICESIDDVRKQLYTTECRECNKETEILHTVWSYKVLCPHCNHSFVLWDHCRSYGKTVRDHKILSEFPCPCCRQSLKKSRLARTEAVPVMLGYRCCTRAQVEHPLNQRDLDKVKAIDKSPPLALGFYPSLPLPDGVNLNQPKRHGLVSVDKLYTTRNLAAASQLWRAIHRIPDAQLAGYLAFAFTSLYQRITRMSEFRFWGGSGNTANYNVPYIFNEANVFKTFERKARSIQDHLETTARHYSGRSVVHTGSATNLSFLPDSSIDLIFTDPPFGANINYSEMNILWESWLGQYTDAKKEAIVNKVQGKDAIAYGRLMHESLAECYRVLRPGHWMLLVFMNSSQLIWQQLQKAIKDAGFSLDRMDIFDKQHGTFKQFVSENTAGADLILHCRKEVDAAAKSPAVEAAPTVDSIERFLKNKPKIPRLAYLHVSRDEDVDYRMLYSEWLSQGLLNEGSICDFSTFRSISASYLIRTGAC